MLVFLGNSIFHTNIYMSAYCPVSKIITFLLLPIMLSSFIASSVLADTSTGFSYFSDILRSAYTVERDYASSASITRGDAIRIAVGIGGWPAGCNVNPSVTCDIETAARSRGLVPRGLGNVNLGMIIRANAIRLVLQARGIKPSTSPSGFSDIDGKMSRVYTSYIAKAREI